MASDEKSAINLIEDPLNLLSLFMLRVGVDVFELTLLAVVTF